MRFAPRFAGPRPVREAILPMINLVFLLLIFFLLAATAAPTPPFDLHLPDGAAGLDAGGTTPLYVGPSSELTYGVAKGDDVFAAIHAREISGPLEMRADGGVPAADVAALLARLAKVGVLETRLVLEAP